MPARSDVDDVFLSPDESPTKEGDQGASPVLRRSNRKRNSVSAAVSVGGAAMSKGSSSKKKKPSTQEEEQAGAKNMPKVVRSPQAGGLSKTDAVDKGPALSKCS